jgi:Pyridoxamine 5'-phosphate oxidase
MSSLAVTAPAFVEIAHRIVWCTVATVDRSGAPRTRILHPIWEWDGERLTGWIATSPESAKAGHLHHEQRVSLTYWDPTHDVATADCDTAWELDHASRVRGWNRFADGPAPVGYDPSIIPFWTDPDVSSFGILRLEPRRLRVMPGTLMLKGEGTLHTWHA